MLTALAALIAMPTASPQLAIELKVMTYNIRYGTANDGKDSWPNRKAALLDRIKTANPHVLGVQEALHDQIEFLRKELPEYEMYGVGRDDGKTKGEYSAVFVQKRLWSLGESYTRWISETPTVAGSKGFGATLPRIITVVTMKGKRVPSFLIVNTHFDHQAAPARLEGARMIADIVNAEKNLATVVMGDFNSSESDPPIAHLLKSTTLQHPVPSGLRGTFTGFKLDQTGGAMIDHIFSSKHFHSVQAEIDRSTYQGGGEKHYPSDHFPVIAKLTIAF